MSRHTLRDGGLTGAMKGELLNRGSPCRTTRLIAVATCCKQYGLIVDEQRQQLVRPRKVCDTK